MVPEVRRSIPPARRTGKSSPRQELPTASSTNSGVNSRMVVTGRSSACSRDRETVAPALPFRSTSTQRRTSSAKTVARDNKPSLATVADTLSDWSQSQATKFFTSSRVWGETASSPGRTPAYLASCSWSFSLTAGSRSLSFEFTECGESLVPVILCMYALRSKRVHPILL